MAWGNNVRRGEFWSLFGALAYLYLLLYILVSRRLASELDIWVV